MTVNLNDATDPDASQASRRGGRRPSRRDEILQAAIDLFAKGGSRDTSIAEIASRIGVTPAAVIHHFKTKELLLSEVVAEIDKRRPELFGSRLDAEFRHIAKWGHAIEENDVLANLIRLNVVMVTEAIDPDHPSHEYFVERQRSFLAQIEAIVRAGMDAGSIRLDADPAAVAALVVGATFGVQLDWFLDPEGYSAASTLDFFAAMLRNVLAPFPARPDSPRPTDSSAG
jgi:AcrR family transcriptional regulator